MIIEWTGIRKKQFSHWVLPVNREIILAQFWKSYLRQLLSDVGSTTASSSEGLLPSCWNPSWGPRVSAQAEVWGWCLCVEGSTGKEVEHMSQRHIRGYTEDSDTDGHLYCYRGGAASNSTPWRTPTTVRAECPVPSTSWASRGNSH